MLSWGLSKKIDQFGPWRGPGGPFFTKGPLKFALQGPFSGPFGGPWWSMTVQEGPLGPGRVPQLPKKFSKMSRGAAECTMYKRCTKPGFFFENHLVHFRVPVGSIEGPGRVLDPIRITSSVPRVPWYGLWSLKCRNIAHTANFLLWAICPPVSLRILISLSGKG